jgi:hypothetical protein
MTSVYVEVLKPPLKPMFNVKDILINVIDTWKIPESEHLKYPTLTEEGNAFCKFLNIKLKHYQAQGAYINFALYDNNELNPEFSSDLINTRIWETQELVNYFKEKNLRRLIVCGQHLHECVLTRETGYNAMKEILPNVFVSPTLCRAYPPDLDRLLEINIHHYMYL